MGLKKSLRSLIDKLPSIDDGEDSLFKVYAQMNNSGQFPLEHLYTPKYPDEDRPDEMGLPLPEPLEQLYLKQWQRHGYSRAKFLRWVLVNVHPADHTRSIHDYFGRPGKGQDKYLRWAEKVHNDPCTFMYLTDLEAEEWWNFSGGNPYKAFDWLRWDFSAYEAQSYWEAGIGRGFMAYLFKKSDVNPATYDAMYQRHRCRLTPGRIYELEVVDMGGPW